MPVKYVVVSTQLLRLKQDALSFGVHAVICDVRIPQPVKQVVWRAVLLEDDDHMLDYVPSRRTVRVCAD